MPDTVEHFTPAAFPDHRQLGDAAAAMFVEVQRADTKATTLCGVAGGLLAVGAAALSSVARSGWVAVAVLACAAVLLGAALVTALSAIRPVVPRGGEFRSFAGAGQEEERPGHTLAAFGVTNSSERARVEAERLALYSGLAQRKFRAVKWAVDLTATALGVAGIGLLSVYITR
ncbi:Pycsar system effector family protein [Actinacidiphila paucisporea]|uniref:Pycsar system effector family protein n=1 Tax=Actinacidiphila paucisporea TaxID=310782 RepID=UPI0009369BE3|nr:Pycsar system effector family protein [Actinacidiphila paucisporea]